jgi:uncharacterized membrane protein YuzA (DUF378 family)
VKTINLIALILVIVGALNWGLVGLFSVDLVAMLFGAMSVVSRVVYTLVGLSGVLVALTSAKILK